MASGLRLVLTLLFYLGVTALVVVRLRPLLHRLARLRDTARALGEGRLSHRVDVARARCVSWLYAPIDPREQQSIRAHLAQERAPGEPRFQAMVEKTLNRPACVRPPGRQPAA